MTRAAAHAAPRRLRLQKFLSDAGVASRRHAEELIEQGLVLVNDRIVDSLPAFVDPDRDRVLVRGSVVRAQPLDYYILNKPRGVVCTNRDPQGRTRAIDLLPPDAPRVFVVGRLDADSVGLLLLTNDGELAQRITHPRFGIAKEYRVEVRGQIPTELPGQLRAGVYLSEGKAKASDVQVTHRGRQRSVMMITLAEGRNRQIRRMLARYDHPVRSLKRVRIGPLSVRGLPLGACRRLTAREIEQLRRAIEIKPTKPRRRSAPRRSAAKAPARRGSSSSQTASTSPRKKRTTTKPTRRRRIIT